MFLASHALTKRFGGLVAVSGVSLLRSRRGKLSAFSDRMGRERPRCSICWLGCSSLLRVEWCGKGRDISGSKPETIAALGLVKTFQNPQLFAELSVLEHVMIASHLALKRLLGFGRYKTFFASKASDRELQARADRVLKLCRLSDAAQQAAGTLSYGEEKMLGVAMAMMCEPKLLLLDEPASGLGQEEIINLGMVLRNLREHGTTLCIIDHKVAFLAQFAQRLVALQNGEKIAEGTPREVLSNQRVITAYLGRQHVVLRDLTAHYGKNEVVSGASIVLNPGRGRGADRRQCRGQVDHNAPDRRPQEANSRHHPVRRPGYRRRSNAAPRQPRYHPGTRGPPGVRPLQRHREPRSWVPTTGRTAITSKRILSRPLPCSPGLPSAARSAPDPFRVASSRCWLSHVA